jgi:hypothetical protein
MSGSDARLFHQLVARVEELVVRIEALETLVESLSDRLPSQPGRDSRAGTAQPRDGKAGTA